MQDTARLCWRSSDLEGTMGQETRRLNWFPGPGTFGDFCHTSQSDSLLGPLKYSCVAASSQGSSPSCAATAHSVPPWSTRRVRGAESPRGAQGRVGPRLPGWFQGLLQQLWGSREVLVSVGSAPGPLLQPLPGSPPRPALQLLCRISWPSVLPVVLLQEVSGRSRYGTPENKLPTQKNIAQQESWVGWVYGPRGWGCLPHLSALSRPSPLFPCRGLRSGDRDPGCSILRPAWWSSLETPEASAPFSRTHGRPSQCCSS